MASKNEFGVESSSGGGFGLGAGDDFEEMFDQATAASVVDDEISENHRRPAAQTAPAPTPSRDYFDTPAQEPVAAPIPSFEDEQIPSGTPLFDEIGFDNAPSFSNSGDLDDMFAQAENASVADDEIREVPAQPEPELESFDSFGSFEDEQQAPAASDSFNDWSDPALDLDPEPAPVVEPERRFAPEPVAAPVVRPEPIPEPAPAPVYYPPTVAEPVPSFVPEPVAAPAPVAAPVAVAAPAPVVARAEADVDYIERVILTSDAIRELEEEDAKAVNMFITAGQPVDSHQELVLTSLLADRQILKTAGAILDAKIKSSVDMAFHILGLDDATFVDFGKILSHDLQSTQTVIFDGDRLQYARKLVDVVEALPPVSIKRFEAVRSVLGAGELSN